MKRVLYEKLQEGDLIGFSNNIDNPPDEIVEFLQMVIDPDSNRRLVLIRRHGGYFLGNPYDDGVEKVYDKDDVELLKLKK